MGTNFYIRGHTRDDMDPEFHIGKRSAAGLYCWDCKVSLCAGGEHAVHKSTHSFFEECPKCGGVRADEELEDGNSVGVELGFSKPRTGRPTGVRGCASFTWAIEKNEVIEKLKALEEEQRLAFMPESNKVIESEYGDLLTLAEFNKMLESNCPIEFVDMVGKWFS